MSILYAIFKPAADAGLASDDGDAAPTPQRIRIDEYVPELHRGRIFCPLCDGPLDAKRGAIKAHHFAHRPGASCSCCDNGGRLELTDWRRAWLTSYDRERVERRFEHDGIARLADAFTANGNVVLFQDGDISVDDLYALEEFYIAANGRLPVWVFDCKTDGRLLSVELHGLHFVVAHLPYASWAHARGLAFLDTPHGMLRITHQNLARPHRVLARVTTFKTDTRELRDYTYPYATLPVRLTPDSGNIEQLRRMGSAEWGQVNGVFRWEGTRNEWTVCSLADAVEARERRADRVWLPAGGGSRRVKAALDLMRTALTTRKPLALPMGPLPEPLEAVRSVGVRTLASSIFSNVVAWNKGLPELTDRWVGFFRSLGWRAWKNVPYQGPIREDLCVHPSFEPGKPIRVFIHPRNKYNELMKRSNVLLASGEKPPFAVVPTHPIFMGDPEYDSYNGDSIGTPFLGSVCVEDARGDVFIHGSDIMHRYAVMEAITSPWWLVRVEGAWLGMFYRCALWVCRKLYDTTWECKPLGFGASSKGTESAAHKWYNALNEI